MAILSSESGATSFIALLLLVVFLPGCGTETEGPAGDPGSPKNDQVVLEVQFYQGKPEAYPAVICTCSTEASGGSVEFGTTFRIDTKGTGNSDNGMILGEGDRFTASFSSTGDGDSFTATIVLVNTLQTELVAKSGFTSVSVTQDGVTIPHDSPLPAGKYTVTLTGKTPQPPASEQKDSDPEG